MRVLALDIGTNSVRYLVCDIAADTSISVVKRGGEITRLGEDLHRTGILDETAIDRTARAVAGAIAAAKKLHAENVVLAATSAARDATNSAYFLDRIKQITGVEAVILSGREEAEAIYRGVTHEMSEKGREAVVLDIGGGSTECIYHDENGRIAFHSVNIGAVRMTERFMKSDPPAEVELADMRSCVTSSFRGVIRPENFPGRQCIGVGGTITTLAAILLGMAKYDRERVHGHILTKADVIEAIRSLASMKLDDRKRVPGLQPARADIIVAGVVALEAFLDLAGFDSLRVSDRGILFGLALRAAED